MDEIIKTFFTILNGIITISIILLNFTKLYKVKGIISKDRLKIVEIKHKPSDYITWKNQKRLYFIFFIMLLVNIFQPFIIIFYSDNQDYIIYITTIIIFIYIIVASLYFSLYKAMGNNSDDGKYIAFNEVEIKIDTDKQNLFYYIQLALCVMHAHTFDLNTDNGFLEVLVKEWWIFPCAILNIYIQQIEETIFLIRVTAHGIYPSWLGGNQYNSRVINRFIRLMMPTIEEREENKKEK